MRRRFLEAVDSSHFNWGKFEVLVYEQEDLAYRSPSAKVPLLSFEGQLLKEVGGKKHLISERGFWLHDLETLEGGYYSPEVDVQKQLTLHRIWVCVLYEPTLLWLAKQDLSDLDALPGTLVLNDVKRSLRGYRRSGPDEYTLISELHRGLHPTFVEERKSGTLYDPESVSAPGRTLYDMLLERQMEDTDLAQLISVPIDTIRGIFTGRVPITPLIAASLEAVFENLPKAFWLQREQKYREYLWTLAENQRLNPS